MTKENKTEEDTNITNLLKKEYEKGFIAGADSTGSQAEEILALKLKEQREELRERVGGINTATGINAIPETNDYANGWNDCRKEAFKRKQELLSDLLKTLE